MGLRPSAGATGAGEVGIRRLMRSHWTISVQSVLDFTTAIALLTDELQKKRESKKMTENVEEYHVQFSHIPPGLLTSSAASEKY